MRSVLLVFPDVPYPLVSGGHLRDWQVLNILNRLGVLPHVLYFGAGEGYNLGSDSPVGRLAASVSCGGDRLERPDSSRAQTLRRKLGYLLHRVPQTHPFGFQYDAMGARERILQHARRTQSKFVILRSIWCHYVPDLQKAGMRVIANCPDYNTLLAWQMVRGVRNPLRKLGPLCNYAAVKKLEERFLPLCDEVWAPTEEEAAGLARIIPRERIVLLPNLLDVASHPDFSGERCNEPVLLFVANFSYLPNANAARLLLKTVFPAIRQEVSAARFLLVGRDLPADLAAIAAREEGVEVLGFVEDLAAVYRRAAVVLLPVVEGAGMLFKTLEALAMGKATVGFAHSFRGIPQCNGAYRVAGSPHEMAREAARLLLDESRRREIAPAARKLAEAELSWEVGADALVEGSILCRFTAPERTGDGGRGLPARKVQTCEALS